MKIGDRVKKSPMWKYSEKFGTVLKTTRDGYTIIKWDDVNGEWHYTLEQASELKLIKSEEES